MGYRRDSPYKNDPYIDIFSPEGLIDMSQTDKNLVGIDEYGNVQYMQAGSQNPYKFEGKNIREIPMKKGGNPFKQSGGEMYNFLFDDEEEAAPVAAPVEEEEFNNEEFLATAERLTFEKQQEDLAMEQGMMEFDNPYRRSIAMQDMGDGLDLMDDGNTMYATDNSFSSFLSSGKYGNQNIGEKGKVIASELTNALGYSPTFNSIYRDAGQQAKLVKQGVGAKNSYHLTGDAVDMKPADWNNLPDDKKNYFRTNYDVIYHNNHYHIEPKG